MHQRAQIVPVRLRQREFGREQIAIGLNHIEVGCVSDPVSRQCDRAGAPQRIDLDRLLAHLLSIAAVGDECIRHVLEGALHGLLVLGQRLALARIGELHLIEIGLHAEQRLDKSHANAPFGRRRREQVAERHRQ